MKTLWRIIKESHYRWWLLTLIILILIALGTYFLFAGDFKNIQTLGILDVIIIGVLVSLFINLISSFITIIFIEERDRIKAEEQAKLNQKVVISKLINPIKNFIYLLANIYKATSKFRVSDIDQRMKNIFYETDILIEHLNNLDMSSEGFDYSYNSMEAFFKNPTSGLEADSWLESLILYTNRTTGDIADIQNYFLTIINDVEIVRLVDEIAKINRFISNKNILAVLRCRISISASKRLYKCCLYPDGVSTLMVYDLLHTFDLIYYLDLLMKRIDHITDTKNFEIPEHIFTDNFPPFIGSGLIKKED